VQEEERDAPPPARPPVLLDVTPIEEETDEPPDATAPLGN